MLIEETEWINTSLSMFTDYLEITESMLASQSNSLYPGGLLDNLGDTDYLKSRHSRVYRLSVTNADAATMFYLNLQSMKDQMKQTSDLIVDGCCTLDELAVEIYNKVK